VATGLNTGGVRDITRGVRDITSDMVGAPPPSYDEKASIAQFTDLTSIERQTGGGGFTDRGAPDPDLKMPAVSKAAADKKTNPPRRAPKKKKKQKPKKTSGLDLAFENRLRSTIRKMLVK